MNIPASKKAIALLQALPLPPVTGRRREPRATYTPLTLRRD